ncbi:hypothetical protein KAM333_09060 [Aeromonas caviae]|nr:hypothetical protein [Aeromonas caviae]GJA05478.1 hypothetical protein KAM333_09060 [Aeromonas caviae]
MKIPSLFLFVALVLPMTPTLVHAQGAPAMPLVVCHVDQAPQMLVPAYLCQWHGGSQHPGPSRPRGGDLLLGHPRFPSFIS